MADIRFSRRISLIPGWLYLNLSKHSISLSLGRSGLTATIGKHGIRFTAGLPGSGLSVSEQIDYDQLKLPKKASSQSDKR